MSSKRQSWLVGAVALTVAVSLPAMAAGHKAKGAGKGAGKPAAAHAHAVTGSVETITADAITIHTAARPAGKAGAKAGGAAAGGASITLGLNADTQYAAVEKGAADDVAVGSLAAVLPGEGDNADVQAILVYKSDAPGAAQALEAAVAALRRLAAAKDHGKGAKAAGGGAKAPAGPLPVIGKITAAADGSVTVEGKERSVTAKLGTAPVGKLVAKTHDDIQAGSLVAALAGGAQAADAKVAGAVVLLPTPAHKGAGKGAKNGAAPAANPPVVQ